MCARAVCVCVCVCVCVPPQASWHQNTFTARVGAQIKVIMIDYFGPNEVWHMCLLVACGAGLYVFVKTTGLHKTGGTGQG